MYYELPASLIFTAGRKRLLQELTIDENQPGTILHDFAVILDIVRGSKQTLTPAQQLPLALLSQINQQLKHPIQLALKRPSRKSYPPVQGLYLLLRTSGLSYVDTSGKQPVLVVDEAAYQQWIQLNATERYGNLLEAWFLRGYAEILGDYSRTLWSLPDNFQHIGSFLARYDLISGLQVAGNRDAEMVLRYSPEWHNLGLLDLFGFINVQSGPPQPGKGWHIERITLTPVGAAFLSLLYTELFQYPAKLIALDELDSTVGVLQKILQPYFPEWQRNLTPTEVPFREGAFIFKVSLGNNIWRRIAIDAKQSLAALASAVLASVDFDEDHLYQFSYRDRFGSLHQIYHPYMRREEPLIASEIAVGSLSLQVGQTMNFLFDFGDEWEFDLLLETIDPNQKLRKAKILETHGDAPAQYGEFDDYDDFEDDENYEDE